MAEPYRQYQMVPQVYIRADTMKDIVRVLYYTSEYVYIHPISHMRCIVQYKLLYFQNCHLMLYWINVMMGSSNMLYNENRNTKTNFKGFYIVQNGLI